ncbi:MAG: ribosomal protein S18-alanine N-acetyltransferase [Mangrovibacterium sp.]
MNTLIISPASVLDLGEISTIEQECFQAEAFSKRQLNYLITTARGLFLLAKYESEIAGYVSIIINARHNTGRMYSIAVGLKYRTIGVGNKLFDAALKYAVEQGLRAVFLEVRTDNAAAIHMYEKNGFIKRCEKKDYYPDGAPAYSMVKYL